MGVDPFTGTAVPIAASALYGRAVLGFVPRCIWGALVASRWNPVIRDFYQRLLADGKPKNSGPDGLYAEADDHTQLHAEKRSGMESKHLSLWKSKTGCFSGILACSPW